ncbi:MAG TPA: hemolysin family protein [Candidatus Acidoferrales bacterium]
MPNIRSPAIACDRPGTDRIGSMIGLRLLAVMALVAVNGFFAAAEFSLVSVRVSHVRQLVERGDARARIVQELLGQLDRGVSGVQLGVTLASLGLGALGESTLAQIVRPMLAWLPGNPAAIVAHAVALALAFALLTTMHVVLGELVPKTISLERAGRASLVIARPFYWYLNAFRPAISVLEGLSRGVVRALGIAPSAGHTLPHSSEELQIQINQARERGILAPSEERFMLGAMTLGQLRVREIMVPRPDMHALPVEAQLDETLALFATTQRSRLPVYQGTLDHILGFVHIKDMLWVLLERERRVEKPIQPSTQPPAQPSVPASAETFDLRRLLREVLIAPESKLASDLLIEMRTRRASLAMIVDEFGSILGLLTLEDLLEQVVGEIHDEYDVVEGPLILGTGSGAAMVFDGGFGLRDLETQYHIPLPDDPAYATLGGFVLAQLGFIPKGGEGFDYAGYHFTVVEMDRRRVARVKVQRLSPVVEQAPPEPSASGATTVHDASPKDTPASKVGAPGTLGTPGPSDTAGADRPTATARGRKRA